MKNFFLRLNFYINVGVLLYQLEGYNLGETCWMMNCTRNVFGTDVLKKAYQDQKFAYYLKYLFDPTNNFLFVTSKSKYEIEIEGLDFDHVVATIEKSLNVKIHFVEIPPEIKDNIQFYKDTHSEFKEIDDENIVYCLTTNSVLLTQDEDTRKNCQIMMCKTDEKIGVAN